MAIHVNTEKDRIPSAIQYAREQIEQLDREINYSRFHDIGTADLSAEKRRWETMLDLLTMQTPFFKID